MQTHIHTYILKYAYFAFKQLAKGDNLFELACNNCAGNSVATRVFAFVKVHT